MTWPKYEVKIHEKADSPPQKLVRLAEMFYSSNSQGRENNSITWMLVSSRLVTLT